MQLNLKLILVLAAALQAYAIEKPCATSFANILRAGATEVSDSSEFLTQVNEEKMTLLVNRYFQTPASARSSTTDPIFTNICRGLLNRNEKFILTRPNSTVKEKELKAYLLYHNERIKSIFAADIQEHGAVSLKNLFRIGYHISFLNSLARNGYRSVPGFLNQRQSVDLRPLGKTFDLIDESVDSKSDILSSTLSIPTDENIGIEDLITLQAKKISVDGIIQKTIKVDDRSYDPEGFFAHDTFHSSDWLDSLRVAVKNAEPGRYKSEFDLEQSPAYQRIMARLVQTTTALKAMPKQKRRAGFLALYNLIHENHQVDFLVEMAKTDKSLVVKYEWSRDTKAALARKLSKPNDLASELPNPLARFSRAAREQYVDYSIQSLREALAK